MPNTANVNTTDPIAPTIHRAGDIAHFPSGQTIYLAPLPLPTDALPHSPHVSDLNDTYLDFGGGKPQVFLWQVTLGGPFTTALLILLGSPIIIGVFGAIFGYEWTNIREVMQGIFMESIGPAIFMFLFGLGIGLVVWIHNHNKYTKVIPTRFNRQRREVCFMPTGAESPTFVPWESLSAWVVQAQGATQYGVHRQYAMGMGYQQAGQQVSVEFMCAGLPLAIAHWEAVRAFMEYEVHDLKSIQDPMDLQGPDDPPHEGVHTFRNARARLHRMIREKEKGWVYGFFWYLFHVMTFWTLPNRLVEWEVRRIAKVGRRALPEAMRSWSEPLPQAQWAKPSEELMRLSKQVKVLKARTPLRSITDIFAEVCQNTKSGQKQRR
ncbi:hypothetical protein [Pseudomonas viridiflava]|uniref:Uncharacterized protein n=1 Tax=Pseudomonas viridiflava TaxID=33069 RepID=A0AA46VUV5_PSEVI|nr:hypothetical protein [Pseudomonas viridiflava]MEE4089405.1 hypothetical protein [Pseudomonas viridiflava]UZA68423.1 hypothetical protein EZZ81_09390 [Pseudomonas viridiflava]